MAHENGPALVLSVAGSGKTSTILKRVERMTRDGVDPDDILLTTFSRLGASDMRRRANELKIPRSVRFKTLHSVAWSAIKRRQPFWTLPPDWWVKETVNEAAEKWLLRNSSDEATGVEQLVPLREILGLIGCAKANLVLPDAWETSTGLQFQSFSDWAAGIGVSPSFADQVDFCYRALEVARRDPLADERGKKAFRPRQVACSHDDALVEFAKAALLEESWIAPFRGKYGHVILDEAQDTNRAQWEIVRWLARVYDHGSVPYTNFMVVGDDQQAIYTFRGADPELLRDFVRREGVILTAYPLSINFRSGQEILDAANKLLEKSTTRLYKGALKCGRPDIKARIEPNTFIQEHDEAPFVAESIEESINAGLRPSQIAVLYRVNATSGSIELELIRRNVPYKILGRGFFSRPEIQAAVKYIALAINSEDKEAYETCYRIPQRWVRKDVLRQLPTLQSLIDMPCGELAARSKGLYRLMKDMERVRRKLDDGLVPALICVFNDVGIVRHFTKDKKAEDETEALNLALHELLACAQTAGDPQTFVQFMSDMKDKEISDQIGAGEDDTEEQRERVTLATVHKCVAPNTLIETDSGLMRIQDAGGNGNVGTACGPKRFTALIDYPAGKMLRIRTKSGYEVDVTTDHKMMVWDGSGYSPKVAASIQVGDFLRLRLGVSADANSPAPLPPPPKTDVRAVEYGLPRVISLDMAEFLGLMVGDGTVYGAGFRLTKQHPEVVDRFSALCERLFDVHVKRYTIPFKNGDGVVFAGEVNSTQLSSWLLSIGGLAPREKFIPPCIMRSPVQFHARFLRGLFEDGTVNAKDGILDHFDWSNVDSETVRHVQVMLLRLGIISGRRAVHANGRIRHNLYVYGKNAHRLRDAIGLISDIKNYRLQLPAGEETMYSVPVARERTDSMPISARQNARYRGYLSRHTLEQLGGFDADLMFHHERVASVSITHGPSMCIEVPHIGRFNQNGFDGCNSKGLEWEEIYLMGMRQGLFPLAKSPIEEERRLAYVAITRAKRRLVTTTAGGNKEGEIPTPSVFLIDAGLVTRPMTPDGMVDSPDFLQAIL